MAQHSHYRAHLRQSAHRQAKKQNKKGDSPSHWLRRTQRSHNQSVQRFTRISLSLSDACRFARLLSRFAQSASGHYQNVLRKQDPLQSLHIWSVTEKPSHVHDLRVRCSQRNLAYSAGTRSFERPRPPRHWSTRSEAQSDVCPAWGRRWHRRAQQSFFMHQAGKGGNFPAARRRVLRRWQSRSRWFTLGLRLKFLPDFGCKKALSAA